MGSSHWVFTLEHKTLYTQWYKLVCLILYKLGELVDCLSYPLLKYE